MAQAQLDQRERDVNGTVSYFKNMKFNVSEHIHVSVEKCKETQATVVGLFKGTKCGRRGVILTLPEYTMWKELIPRIDLAVSLVGTDTPTQGQEGQIIEPRGQDGLPTEQFGRGELPTLPLQWDGQPTGSLSMQSTELMHEDDSL